MDLHIEKILYALYFSKAIDSILLPYSVLEDTNCLGSIMRSTNAKVGYPHGDGVPPQTWKQ